LSYLKRNGASFTAGIEYVSEVANTAEERRAADAIHCLNVETDSLPYAEGRFDCIVMSHVLEHMVDPWCALSRVLTMLRPGGTFVGAIPNVRYLPVICDLVFGGRFDYQQSGVMDRTHLRFFTRKSIANLLEGAGLEIVTISPDINGKKAQRLARISGGLLNDFVCYAYTFRCTKPHESGRVPAA
jgi:2-polyprenyl-3-methyl-5-hydroxy-6-metoxy-1,4-benzoquinol methylase